MTPKDKPKRGGAKPFVRETKPRAETNSGFSAKGGLKQRKNAGEAAVSGKLAKPVKTAPARAATTDGPAKPERISKILARAGVASRRDVERMIMEGRVRLNSQLLDTPVVNATLEDRIEVDGHPIRGIERTRLWLYHKPAGLVTTNSDPEGRDTVFDNLPESLPRVLSIGRLDINTEGLLLLTNDGGLSRVLELPTTGWLRRYRVRAHGEVEQADLDKLKEGIAVDGVLYGAIEATLDRQQGRNVWLTMGLREGKNREIKNVLGALGLEVNRLIRISYGPFQLGDLPEGEVIEVRGRTLRDQLGPRLIEDAKANFDAPVYNETGTEEASADHAQRPEKRDKGGWSKETRPQEARSRDVRPDARREEPRRDKAPGRPQSRRDDRGVSGKSPRGGFREERSFDDGKPKKRSPMGTTRTANVWMAPGARPTTDVKEKRTSARADAERLFEKPKPHNDRQVVINRVAEDRDWIRGEDAPARREEGGKRSVGDRPYRDQPRNDRPGGDRPAGGRPLSDKPRGQRAARPNRDRPRSDAPRNDETRSDRTRGERPAGARPFGDKPRGKSFGGKPGGSKPYGGKPAGGKPAGNRGKPSGGRPGGRPPGGKPRTPRG
ncbi:MAG TPA: pseudouridine synthase [Pseudorhizobium sp.]|nr:pseudouridine synthase [Pseudorhizobium sp.]